MSSSSIAFMLRRRRPLLAIEIERDAMPANAVHAAIARALPIRRHGNAPPRHVVERGIGPHRAISNHAGILHRQLAEQPAEGVARRAQARVFRAMNRAQRAVGEMLRAERHPRFDVAAAPRGVDDADRNAECFAQIAREVVRHGREAAGMRGVRARPLAAGNVGLRRVRPRDRNLELAQERVVRDGDLMRTAAGLRERPFHVRLPRRNPDVAHEHVVEIDLAHSGAD